MSESASAPGSQVRSTSPRLMSSSARASPGSTRGTRSTSHTPDQPWIPSSRSRVPTSPPAHVELVDRGVIELLEAPTGGTHGGLPPLGELVVGREPAVVDDVVRRAAAVAAELRRTLRAHAPRGHGEPAVRALPLRRADPRECRGAIELSGAHGPPAAEVECA